MSTENVQQSAPETEQIRRRGDRRVADVAVADDRRKGDRRNIPGVRELFRTLLRRDPSSEI